MKFEKIQTLQDIELLKFARHLRLEDGAKMIIGRDENDNLKLQEISNDKFDEIKFEDDIIGAYSLLSKNASKNDKLLAARLALTYAKTKPDQEYNIIIAGEKIRAYKFENKQFAQKYFIVK